MSKLTLFPGRDLNPTHSQSSRQRDGGSNGDNLDVATIALELLKLGITIGLTYYLGSNFLKILSGALDPASKADGAAIINKKSLAKRLKRPEIETMDFDSYEQNFLNDIIGPEELDLGFQDIGGMDEELEEVKDNIVLPIQLWNRFKHDPASAEELPTCPSGVLLYGAPGTGKSLTAKAIAKEAGATFINIKASAIMDKFLGESDKLVSAIFRLARKLGPSVIFIDEVETVLRKREAGNPFGSSGIPSMQGVFLSEWDGLNVQRDNLKIADSPAGADPKQLALASSVPAAPVVVLGATNRPMDLDRAFLRRMPVQVMTKVPDASARLAILRAQLSRERLAGDVNLEELARCTEGYTGSDIRELIRVAKQRRLKVLMVSAGESIALVSDSTTAPSTSAQTAGSGGDFGGSGVNGKSPAAAAAVASAGSGAGSGRSGRWGAGSSGATSPSALRSSRHSSSTTSTTGKGPASAAAAASGSVLQEKQLQRQSGTASSSSSVPGSAGGASDVAGSIKGRPLSKAHLAYALNKTRVSVSQTKQYGKDLVVDEMVERGYVIER